MASVAAEVIAERVERELEEPLRDCLEQIQGLIYTAALAGAEYMMETLRNNPPTGEVVARAVD